MLAPHVDATPSVVSWHLRHLAGFGFVTDADPDQVPGDRRQRWWVAVARGFRVDSDDPAAEMLADEMWAAALGEVETWAMETRQSLPPEWLRLAGPSNTQVALTAGELEELADKFEELLAPYVTRSAPPDGARDVRILRHFMPQ